MRYGSVCSGIEAASVAWHSLGWEAQWFSEIEHFPSEVLKYRFPNVPNLGDMTQLNQFQQFNEQPIDLLVGGTPCQSFSVAGLRKGLADPRGNLMLTFLSIADKRRPKWILWENVPGVLSSNGGKDFSTFLGALGELGYGFAYRVLDAQHFGVAQRRRRVFVVGYLGDWRPAAAVLFESESLQRDSKPSRKKRQEIATDAQGGFGTTGNPKISNALCAHDYKGPRPEADRGAPVIIEQVAQPKAAAFIVAKGSTSRSIGYREENAPTLVADQGNNSAVLCPSPVAQPIPINTMTVMGRPSDELNPRMGIGIGNPNDPCPTLTKAHSHAVAQPIAAHKVSPTITAKMQGMSGWAPYNETEHLVPVAQPIAVDWRTTQVDIEKTGTLKTDLAKMSGPCIAVDTYNQTVNHETTQTIRANTSTEHIGAVMQPTIIDRAAFNQGQNAQYEPRIEEGQTMPSLVAKGPHAVANPKVFDWQSGGDARGLDLKDTAQLQRCQTPALLHTMAIRRLTPKECERLQGFPDDWTKIPYRNKPADQCPDGPRYKACGNSMAVPVMRWIGERIQMIENYLNPNL